MATGKRATIDANTIDTRAEWLRGLNGMTLDTYVGALANGAVFPPIAVETGSLRLLDGLHRLRAWQKHEGRLDIQVPVLLHHCATEADALLIAAAGNATHGSRWNSTDEVRLIALAERAGIDPAVFGRVLSIPPVRYQQLSTRRWINEETGAVIPVKTSLSHLVGQVPTPAMLQMNKIASLSVARQARDITKHLQAGTVDWENKETVTALVLLARALEKHLAAVAA